MPRAADADTVPAGDTMTRSTAASGHVQAFRRVLAAGCLLGAVALAAPPVVRGQAPPGPPPLPRLEVDSFPDASRPAIVAALRAAHARPTDAEAVGALAMLLQAWQQFDSAAGAYQRAQGLAPQSVDWWYLGGVTDTARALPESAARQFARAEPLAADRADLVRLRLADACLAAGADDRATVLYRALTATPDYAAAAWYGLGRLALRRHDDAAAREALEKAVSLYPDFGAAHYALAQVHRRAGATDEASVALARQQTCPACVPPLADPWQALVETLRDDAFALLTRGIAIGSASGTTAVSEAIRLHEAALGRPETRGLANLNLIELYRRAGDPERARRHYLAALEEPGLEADAQRQYAAVLLEANPVEALALLERATTQAPRNAAAWQGRGMALERLGRVAEAADAYTTALQIAPDAHEARFGLARLAMRAGQVDAAIVHLEALRTPQRAETPRYLFALATAYLRRGRQDDAVRVAGEALSLARGLGDERLAAYIEGELRKLRGTP